MTQFASTLFPQTNPTNPILHAFRVNGEQIVLWRDLGQRPSDAQIAHAQLVMRRLNRLRKAMSTG